MVNFDEIWVIVTQMKFDVCFVGWCKSIAFYDIDQLQKVSQILGENKFGKEYFKGKELFSWRNKKRYLKSRTL